MILVFHTAFAEASDTPRHHLEVWLHPDRLVVEDRIEFDQSASGKVLSFLLGDAFTVETSNATRLGDRQSRVRGFRRYRVRLEEGSSVLSLRYSGELETGRGSADPRAMPGIVYDAQGVYLDGRSGWYPVFDGPLLQFSLTVHHPDDWRVLSQGEGSDRESGTTSWVTATPQDTIYLLAGPYHRYQRPGGTALAQVFLRSPDQSLADRYLGVTERYLDLYSRLLGPYPFPKFAAVENRWQTGFGMPSFTLLGSRVMRLPFIITSSYPHEIVHNWLGNSVFPDYGSGNWSEGLTSYLADHLIQEQQGGGARYRRGVLQKYADYVSAARDFPLRQFRARHSGATQAVGYGKALMLFHMLRQRIGDDGFRRGLREFVREYQWKTAGFDDIQRIFQRVGDTDLGDFFTQWVERTGAPQLALAEVTVVPLDDGRYRLRGELRQMQSGKPYDLAIPLVVTLADRDEAVTHRYAMDGTRGRFAIDLPARPFRLDVDPRFDLFRKLSAAELPPSLGQIFGAEQVHLILPAKASPEEREAFRSLALSWQQRFPGLTIGSDSDSLPESGGVWLLGAENRHAERVLAALEGRYAEPDPRTRRLTIESEETRPETRTVVLTVRRSNDSTLGWIVPHDVAAIPLLARKLPHYGKYSYLTFAGEAVRNVVKAEWPVLGSPLSRALTPGASVAMGALPPEQALIR